MNINQINGFSNNLTLNNKKNSGETVSDAFSKALENLKKGRAADYDEEKINAEGTTTTTQIMSDGSVLVTVTDANGKVISQNKTRSMTPDPNAHIIDTIVETKGGLADSAILLNMLGANAQ